MAICVIKLSNEGINHKFIEQQSHTYVLFCAFDNFESLWNSIKAQTHTMADLCITKNRSQTAIPSTSQKIRILSTTVNPRRCSHYTLENCAISRSKMDKKISGLSTPLRICLVTFSSQWRATPTCLTIHIIKQWLPGADSTLQNFDSPKLITVSFLY